MDPYEPPTRPYIARPRGLSTLPTGEIDLPPKFLDQIKEVAPRKKRSKIWIVLLVGLAGGGAWLGLTARGRALVARVRHTRPLASTAPSISTQAPLATTNSIAAPVSEPVPSTTVSATPSASAPASATASPSAKPATKHRKHH